MSSTEKARNKDMVSFHRLCKDLYKFIQKRIIKKYINPQFNNESSNSINNLITKSKEWKYFNTKETISDEEKILDIFKDNVFLAQLKNYYEALETIINTMDENVKNIELLQKDLDIGAKKMEMLSKLNVQLNQLFSNDIKGQNVQNNNINNNGNNNLKILNKINLVKSLNLLNEMKIFSNNSEEAENCIKNTNTTSNTTITNNNNIILDNKIINNNIREAKPDPIKEKERLSLKEDLKEKENNSNKQQNPPTKKKNKNKNKNALSQNPNNQNVPQNNDIPLLNRKIKRDESILKENDEIFLDVPRQKINLGNNNFMNNNNNNNNNNSNNCDNNIINNNCDNNIDNNNNSNKNNNNNINKSFPQINNNDTKNMINNFEVTTSHEKIEKIENNSQAPIPLQDQVENNHSQSHEVKIENSEKFEEQTNLEQEFEKVLKDKFSFVSNIPEKKIPKQKKEIITEITQIIKKTRNLKFNKKNKFDDPYLVGSYARFNVINLMDYVPPIDIMFKCKNIRSVSELKEIVNETMKKRMGFNYIELSNEYDKKNEIVKFYHKCKITKGPKDINNLFILFNIFFVGVNLSNFVQKEQSINRFFFNNNSMYDNEGKILISLYFRRWRKKYNLLFIMPEFLDIITNFYFNDKNNLSFIIEEIFLDLFNGHFRFFEKKEGEENDNINAAEDVENMKEIKQYILEWYNIEEYKKKMCDAILDTQELIMNSKFSSTFSCEKEI